METVKIGITISGLIWNSILDLREKKISLMVVIFYALIGMGYQIINKNLGFWIVAALIPGLLALAFAKLTREKIGYGDGLLLLALGCYLAIEELVLVCMIAVCLAGTVALILLLFFHKGRDYAIPFVPFLLCGYIMECFLCG